MKIHEDGHANPYADLPTIQQQYYELLRQIQGFVVGLQGPLLEEIEQFDPQDPFIIPVMQDWRFDPQDPFIIPVMPTWRSRKIPRRAKDIEDQAIICKQSKESIEHYRSWRGLFGSSIEALDSDERIALTAVRTLQLNEPERPTKYNARIGWFSIEGLKKRLGFRKSHPFLLSDRVATKTRQNDRVAILKWKLLMNFRELSELVHSTRCSARSGMSRGRYC